MHSQDLYEDLEQALLEVERLIDVTIEQAKRMGVSPYGLMDSTGQLMLAPLVITKAQILIPLIAHREKVEAQEAMDASMSEIKEGWDTIKKVIGVPKETE